MRRVLRIAALWAMPGRLLAVEEKHHEEIVLLVKCLAELSAAYAEAYAEPEPPGPRPRHLHLVE